MAKNLMKNAIDVTMMTDSAAPFVISRNDPDKINIDLIIIGADVIGLDGSVLNKIGSYSLALAAKNSRIPFYSATSLLKVRKDIDSYREIDIEKRDPTELWPAAAKAMAGKLQSLKGIKAINYAFDTVPPEYITGLITEFGILKPKEVKKKAIKKYKEVFK
jgi:methylthioribose-1-phosphate isomerase